MNNQVKLKLRYHDASVPKYETEMAAGMDISAYLDDPNKPIEIRPGERKLIKTGLSMAIPRGIEMSIRPRSGLALKHGITVLNSPGTVDADYRGEIGVILINHGDQLFSIRHGDRIAQAIFNKVESVSFRFVSDLDETERGSGGFGHTGV
ncbi:dUTP pyrophosphatase [Thermoactinomyces sp. DSM 45891]|uniref:dUTP diphosphatase n=1 Tax=Thermoactinomyces sp. DSM 45891 TaxID=1761907 RepID=UPI0009216731|nr:dUTP diphosphatase [Thermoactinomyces sp. DSM 45891]SFX47834.1 dUTP pyrophosphatase [Thermoactinomyces sp. DSM 45891]